MSEAGTAAPAASTDTGAATGDAGAALSTPAAGRERGADGKFAPKAAAAGAEGHEANGAGADTGQPGTPSRPPSDDWRAVIDDPSLKELATRISSPTDVLKIVADLRKANSSMVKLPGKDAKPEDIEKFRNAVGAGKDAEAYLKAFPVQEGVQPSDVDKALQAKTAEVLLKHNVPVAVAGELGAAVTELAKSIDAERQRVADKWHDDAKASLRMEWGADYDANVNLANRAIRAFGGQELVDFMSSLGPEGRAIGDTPEVVKAFGKIGRSMGEGQFIGAVGSDEVKSLDQQIEEFYAKYPPNSQERKRRQKELDDLFERRHGTAPADGRVA
jgi:hypothetical protein